MKALLLLVALAPLSFSQKSFSITLPGNLTCEPPKKDPLAINMTSNCGDQDCVKCTQDSNEKWTWKVDQEASERMRKSRFDLEEHKRKLYWALRSRVLTDAEMEEVEHLGTFLVTHDGQSYFQVDVDRQFNEALLQQFRLRIAAASQQKPK